MTGFDTAIDNLSLDLDNKELTDDQIKHTIGSISLAYGVSEKDVGDLATAEARVRKWERGLKKHVHINVKIPPNHKGPIRIPIGDIIKQAHRR